MTKNYSLQSIEGKIISLDDKIESISSSIARYRDISDFSDVSDVIPVLLDKGESLFDGMFQSIIQNLDIISSSEEEASFNLILENTSDAVIELDDENTIIHVNSACLSIFDYREFELVGKSIYDIIITSYHKSFDEKSSKLAIINSNEHEIKKSDIDVFRGITKNGKVKSFESFSTSIMRDSKKIKLVIIRDLTYNKSLMDELKESKNNYDALSETIAEVIIRIDEKYKIIFANSAVKQVFGYEREELINKDFKILFPISEFTRYENEFLKYFYVDFKDRTEMGLKKVVEILGKNKNRGVSPMEMSFGNAKDISGRTLTCIIRDISSRKNIERKLKQLAFHDKLTSLGNRELFDTEMKVFFADLENNSDINGALFFLDLDGFKKINDTFGHHAGDELLIQTAKRLRSTLRDNDAVYRFGGDEFVILLRNIRKKSEASIVAGNVLNEIRRPYTLKYSKGTPSVNIGVSIGISLIPESGNNIDTVTKNADIAMYRAKETGKNRFVFYSKKLGVSAHERWDMEQGMKLAITNGEIDMFYQPIVDENRSVKGFEALIRWFHPSRGYIPPDKYIPIAEETGFIIPMSNWILEKSCRGLKKINSFPWGKNIYVSINLSAKQFDHKDIVSNIESVIKRTGVNPSNLRLELTETSIMSAPERISSIMEEIKSKHNGIKFVVDDFGTGYSSLSYLTELPVDSLKIDLSFVTKLFQKNNQKIVNSILNLSESLELEVVAEGIEEMEQSKYFTDRNCNSLQGYLFSKAQSLKDLKKSY